MTTEQSRKAERMLFDALDAVMRGEPMLWAEMFHDDGVMEFPYAPPGYIAKLEGKAAIAEYMRRYPELISPRSFRALGVYHCDDTLIAEFVGSGVSVPTGATFEMTYVSILTIEDGKIRRYRDYWNPLTAIQASGDLTALRALGGEEDGR